MNLSVDFSLSYDGVPGQVQDPSLSPALLPFRNHALEHAKQIRANCLGISNEPGTNPNFGETSLYIWAKRRISANIVCQ